MINRNNLKFGDEVMGIYTEGYARPGIIVPMIIKKVTKKYIYATKKNDGSTNFKFINDNELLYESLLYSRTQRFFLFLGTEEEAVKYDRKREESENYYSQKHDFILSRLSRLPKEDLEKIVDIIKKHG